MNDCNGVSWKGKEKMTMGIPRFTVFERTDKPRKNAGYNPRKKSTWYVSFTNEDGTRTTYSLDKYRRKAGVNTSMELIRNKQEAVKLVMYLLDKNAFLDDDSNPLFSEYLLDFWDWDKSEYIRESNQRKANSLSKAYCYKMEQRMENHVLPNIPTSLRLQNVNSSHIDHIINAMLDKGLSHGTCQLVLAGLSTPFKEAFRRGMTASNPMAKVKPVASQQEKIKGIFTPDQVRQIVATLDGFSKEPGDTDRKVSLMVQLTLYTGMRIGELQALNVEQIEHQDFGSFDILNIDRAYNPIDGIKTTKGKYSRKASIPKTLSKKLEESAGLKTKDHGQVFWSDMADSPITQSTVNNHLNDAIKAMGITNEERMEQGLSFHSLRHTFVSLMRGRISDKDLKEVVGHKSDAIQDHYTHETDSMVLAVGQQVAELWKDEEK